MLCPNCNTDGHEMLFSHEAIGIVHCGCYYSGGGMWEFPDMLDLEEAADVPGAAENGASGPPAGSAGLF
jgi:hypothetical protein